MYARWLDDGLAEVLRQSEEPLVLKRRQSSPGENGGRVEFDPMSEDVLRRYRIYAAELAAFGPTS